MKYVIDLEVLAKRLQQVNVYRRCVDADFNPTWAYNIKSQINTNKVERKTAFKFMKAFGLDVISHVEREKVYYSNPEYLKAWLEENKETLYSLIKKGIGIKRVALYRHFSGQNKMTYETAQKMVKYFGRESVIVRVE